MIQGFRLSHRVVECNAVVFEDVRESGEKKRGYKTLFKVLTPADTVTPLLYFAGGYRQSFKRVGAATLRSCSPCIV